ncbi:unnamed protein product [Ilex paraguariensis]|uniref:Uncharacterized protein n=1 Tax=Ilex paraguariensis TaxID=185542 RepID=A0ABC8RG47_9AQUA
MEDERDTSTLRSRPKKSSMSLSSCFHGGHRRLESFESLSSSPIPSSIRSPGAWFRSKAHEVPEIKGKCKSFIPKMGRYRRHSSADFSYDPLSYALNFEDDEAAEEPPTRNFSTRLLSLPQTPRRLADLPIPKTAEPRRNVEGPTTTEVQKSINVATPRKAMVEGRRSDELKTPRAVAVEEVRRSLEEEAPVVVSRPPREVMCFEYPFDDDHKYAVFV